MSNKPKIGLALGSGAAKGLAHIGVLKALEENNIEIDYVAGSSIGALIGSIYCCGIDPDTIERIAMQLDRKLWVDLSVPKRGFIKGDRIEEIIKLLTKERNIEDLDKKLAIVATDLKTSKRYIFTEGPIYKAVRASISIPGIFIPLKMNNMVLVDGGVTDRLPVTVVKQMGADIVIGVDVGFSNNQGRINHIFDVILQSIDVMSMQILSNSVTHADILIEPHLSDIRPSRFDEVEKCVKRGYNEAKKRIGDINKVLEKSIVMK
ncbi:patatin-like phospholipase family protein [Thermohalobacter berrensis]|uniref:Esterase n=1 Tax=Thermohalobacter berrensis TaxID=99594 RepID=A0A419TA92_9FIRM|nr:patatin-like phospholipase family protein [Thermohalobacter berrensis]RKD34391.1 esterase [Thermohalobacter berrensis]